MENTGMKQVVTYEEMAEVLNRMGIIPLAGLIPEHPSLNGLTKEENWHTGSEQDPWGWRVRFPGDGLAAYGKLIKKKAVLIAREWVPAFAKAIGSDKELEERYNSGLASKESLALMRIIREQPGIETRELRSRAEMKAKESKTTFENALTELQGNFDIVISGVKARINAEGEESGWKSTSYEPADIWMVQNGIEPFEGTREEAIVWLRGHMESSWTREAVRWIEKALAF
ncbi:hypothetical protein [Paenibacillus sp. NFR01]|uniref:AlkZ-related protein n=1 Tax=Paenibacillus sp. NFR01 TaxID=1566279 RepID=UPI0008B960CC|nr:hypothetical protein [Paenibacillus sp. NFR01]SET28759.1 hypothetical protein SAMN03159358_1235 [Paenibacillus sp. NFR01]